MTESEVNRKLAAILSADVVGYGKLMADDKAATVETLKKYRAAISRVIERHKGRVVNAPGDNILADFVSAVEAVAAAVEIQKNIEGRNAELPEHRQMQFRVGVNLGDVIEEADGTIYGDGVNIAARMEALADEGGIGIASAVYEAVEGKLDFGFDYLGEQPVKNVERPVRVYRVRGEADRERAPSPKHKTVAPRRILLGSGALVVVAVVGTSLWFADAFDRLLMSEPPAETVAEANGETEAIRAAFPDKASVAVLPFENLSAGDEHDYVADGLHENIIATLSQARRLFVPARFSTLQYKGSTANIGEVARTLGVEHVLEGSVQVADERVRVTMQLIQAATGGHIWAERYDRRLDNIFELQDEITLSVARELQVELVSGAELSWRGGTENLQARALAEQSLRLMRKFTKESHLAARRATERALELDLDYGLAWH